MTLREASSAFLKGYEMARRDGDSADPAALLDGLAGLRSSIRPFAFEGAAMALAMMDAEGAGERCGALIERSDPVWHTFLKLGIGCAWARLGREAPTDPLVLDGYGFQLGLRDGVWGIEGRSMDPPAERGRGRALWFVTGGDGSACAAAISRAAGHRGELWRGVGTACAFAGDPRGHAARLSGLANGLARHVRRGVEQGLQLWRC
ncbi:MAG TPA: DUF1702 family protein, partial [Longimicrobiales bacterium]|nr:DUF1702 family protein [Longimicrobiales bacterium]